MSVSTLSYHNFSDERIAFRADRRLLLLIVLSGVVLVMLVLFASTFGSSRLSVDQVARGIIGTADKSVLFIVRTVRLPRIAAAVLVGMALAVSGNLFQNILGNPLASPGIIGINSGASAAVVFVITAGLPSVLVPVASFAAAMGTATLIYLLAFRRGMSPLRLILVGIGINALFGAAVQFMLVRGDIHAVSQAYRWLVGSLYTADWKDIRNLLVLPLIIVAAGGLQRSIRTLQLGNDAAASVGLSVNRSHVLGITTACLSSSLAVSVAGPIGFVALIVPHMSRAISKRRSLGDLLLAANFGGILVLFADIAVQNWFPDGLPVGITIAVFGAPYFLYLLARFREPG